MHNLIKRIPEALKEVYQTKRYYAITGAVALFIVTATILYRNHRLIVATHSAKIAGALLLGAPHALGGTVVMHVAVTGVLAGVVMSMTLFLLARQIRFGLTGSLSGFILSIIAPVCPACAVGVLGLTGVGSVLALLPFQGAELRFLGTGVLAIMLLFLAKKVTATTCNVIYHP